MFSTRNHPLLYLPSATRILRIYISYNNIRKIILTYQKCFYKVTNFVQNEKKNFNV